MTNNAQLIERISDYVPDRLEEVQELFSPDFEWHYFNKMLPDINKTYRGIEGFKQFFSDLAGLTDGTFNVSIVSLTNVGTELIVAHVNPAMTMDGDKFMTDAVVVWRVVDGKLAEAWDIPGIHSAIRPIEAG